MPKVKLTKAQRETLQEIAIVNSMGFYAVRGYKPAAKLVELGLACESDARSHGRWLRLTDAGRKWLGGGG